MDISTETNCKKFLAKTPPKREITSMRKWYIKKPMNAFMHFIKDKGAAGADGDDIGTIEFISDDDGQTQTSFAKIVAEWVIIDH